LTARHDIADHEQIGVQIELLRAVTLYKTNALSLELRAHGRVDAGVAAGDRVPGAAREYGETAHERAADSEDVDMHKPVVPRGRVFAWEEMRRKGRKGPSAKDAIVTDTLRLPRPGRERAGPKRTPINL